MTKSQDFKFNVQKALGNGLVKHYLPKVLMGLNQRREIATKQFSNLNLAKQRASYAKWKVTENLDKYLVDFEAAIVRKGGKVLWAHDAQTAKQEILQIIKRNNSAKVVKTKTAISSEIGLNQALSQQKVNYHEINFGDFLLGLTGQTPTHMVFGSLLQQPEELIKVLNEKVRVSLEADSKEVVSDIRDFLRDYIYNADIAITGANFLIADSGLAAIADDDGSSRLALAMAKTHIIVAGIDKIIPSVNDIDLFFSLYASYSSGSKLNTYCTLTGPKSASEIDGPDEFIVVLVDNGRSDVLATQNQREALYCIKCGACANVCPVYSQIGQEAYGEAYAGPYGSVVMPLTSYTENAKQLSYASTSCGKCNLVCPVGIDLQNHIIRNRKETISGNSDKLVWYTWKKFVLSRKNLNRAAGIRNFTFKQLLRKEWGEERIFPAVSDKSFNQMWREQNGL